MLRQVGKRKAFLGPLQFDEIGIQLDAIVAVLAHRETQEHRCIAGTAFVDETDVAGLVAQQRCGIGRRLGVHVRVDAAIGTLEADALALLAVKPPRFVYDYRHVALFIICRWTAGFFESLCHVSMHEGGAVHACD